jgi:antitoxin StbD
MNAPFKIENILAEATVGISDLKKNPAAVIAEARVRQVAILNRNRPVAYVVSPETWEYLTDMLADQRLERDARAELEDTASEGVEVNLDAYL